MLAAWVRLPRVWRRASRNRWRSTSSSHAPAMVASVVAADCPPWDRLLLATRRGGRSFRAAGRWPCHTRAQLGQGRLLHGHTGGRLALVYLAAEYRPSGAIRSGAGATRAGRDQPSRTKLQSSRKRPALTCRSQVAIAGADQPQLDRDRPGSADPSDLARAWSPAAWPDAAAGQRHARPDPSRW
jgi:hypothetical protein